MLEFDQTWVFLGSSGAGTPVQVTGAVNFSAWYASVSTASTATVEIQSAMDSTGPWFVESSTSLTTGSMRVLRITGPLLWVRPNNNSTGDRVTVRGVGVS